MKKSASTNIITTFLITIAVGTIVLLLPFSTVKGSIAIEDALFTSASAVTVTGLIVKDTATDFTLFGQIVILVLLQIGGLGFMTFSTFTILLMGKSFSLKDKSVIENDFTAGSYKNLKDLLKKIVFMTFAIEIIGAVVLYYQFTGLSGGRRIFSSIFHSVSAFCNAGFSIFSNSLEDYIANTGINITLMVLIILGGIGFLVMSETLMFLRRKIKRFSRFSLHSKLVLITSALLILAGFIVIFLEELLNKSNTLPLGTKILSSLFQSVTARTAGFNTINLNYFSFASIFIILLLMFVGASPGSTGGGIKTSSTGVVIAYLRSRLRGRQNVDLFYRNIPTHMIEKAFIVIIISFLLISVSAILLLTFEPGLKMPELVFETVSAFGTVGLSMGITAQLSLPSKLIIMVTMFIGRIGPLTLLIALSKRESRAVFNYPEENIMIG
jgi:trk system potassium uptake protein TrkH